MQVNIHHPKVAAIKTFDDFHSVELSDHGGGFVTTYIAADWSDWDAMVAAVAEYRQRNELGAA